MPAAGPRSGRGRRGHAGGREGDACRELTCGMSPAGGPARGRCGDASRTCSQFWPCCSGFARPRRSQVRTAGTPGRPHPSAVCGCPAVPAHLGVLVPGRRRPRLCPRALVARGRQAEGRGGAAALCSECPALAIHSPATGVRATPATAGSRERTGVVRALHAPVESLRHQTLQPNLGRSAGKLVRAVRSAGRGPPRGWGCGRGARGYTRGGSGGARAPTARGPVLPSLASSPPSSRAASVGCASGLRG